MKILSFLVVILAIAFVQAGVIISKITGLFKGTTSSLNITTRAPVTIGLTTPTTKGGISGPLTTEGPSGDCAIRIQQDEKDPPPLLTYHDKLEWLTTNTQGVVEIKNGQLIDMHCSKSFAAPYEKLTTITAKCSHGINFLVNGTSQPINKFSCKNWPVFLARRTGRSCNGGSDLLKAGFEVTKGFLQTMDICYDEVNQVTRYVHHVLDPSIQAFKINVPRPRFAELDFFASKKVDNLYTKQMQKKTFSTILGMDASKYFDDAKDIFLGRGHLAAKSDFVFSSPQRSTFLFVNVAPQWQAFNGGNWESIESGVRNYVATKGLTVDCYTGVYGVATLPDANGTQKELYLSFDEKKVGTIPVPKIYFRVVIDRKSRKGIVLAGVNNPHATKEQILKDYVICNDIGGTINWIKWLKEDLVKGYSFACSVPDFVKVVKHLPLEALQTTGTLT